MDVLPADVGSPLARVTVTDAPSVTISVGPGTCMVGHVCPAINGANPAGVVEHP